MSVALRTITRLQDADDINVSLGAGVDEYALCWDNDTARFVLRAPFAGLLATGATTGATSQAQTFTNGIVGPSWKPSADSTTALQLQNASGTSVLNVNTANARVGIGTTSPAYKLDVVGAQRLTAESGDVFVLAGNNTANYTDIKQTGQGLDIFLYNFGTTYSTSGRYIAASALYDAGGVGGLGLAASNAAGVIRFYTNGSNERMRVTAAGLVGIGTTAPATRLDIDAGALTMKEMTAPTGVADKAMLYTKDNGSGKTQLCCKLGDDVEIVIATQA